MGESKINNMEEFAVFSGVSRPTVSKYFHDPQSVRASTRAKIEDALSRCGYRPNIFAVNQNRKLTKNIGIVVPYLADPFFAEMARRIENLIIRAGLRPILLSSHGDPELETSNLDALRAIKPACVLLAPLGRMSDRAAIEAFCADMPTVNFDSRIEGAAVPFLGHDNVQATKIMLNYLIRTGEPPVFFEMKTPPNPNANKRRQAYLSEMERQGHVPQIIQVEGEGWDLEQIGYAGARRALTQKQLGGNTVFCSNDRLAIGFIAAAYELGLRVGFEKGCALRVAGHDNHPYSRYTCPTLTTISHDYNAIAHGAVEAVLALIEAGVDAPPEPKTVLFDGELIMRASA